MCDEGSNAQTHIFICRCPPMGWNLWETWDQVSQDVAIYEWAAPNYNYFPHSLDSHACFLSSSADLSNAQCIPAPLATPIPVSDDPASSVVTPCTELSESPSSQALSPMQYSVPVSEHMDDCNSSVMKDKLDSLLDCIPNKVSDVSEGQLRCWSQKSSLTPRPFISRMEQSYTVQNISMTFHARTSYWPVFHTEVFVILRVSPCSAFPPEPSSRCHPH